jgi:hypothetical protein
MGEVEDATAANVLSALQAVVFVEVYLCCKRRARSRVLNRGRRKAVSRCVKVVRLSKADEQGATNSRLG